FAAILQIAALAETEAARGIEFRLRGDRGETTDERSGCAEIECFRSGRQLDLHFAAERVLLQQADVVHPPDQIAAGFRLRHEKLYARKRVHFDLVLWQQFVPVTALLAIALGSVDLIDDSLLSRTHSLFERTERGLI